MKKKDFIKAISDITGFTQKDVRAVLDAIQVVTVNALNSDQSVKLIDGVTLSRVHKEACQRRNPATGGIVDVPAKYVPKCKIGTALKNAVI